MQSNRVFRTEPALALTNSFGGRKNNDRRVRDCLLKGLDTSVVGKARTAW